MPRLSAIGPLLLAMWPPFAMTSMAQSTLYHLNNTGEWGLTDPDILPLSDGGLLLYDGWTMARTNSSGALVWARNYDAGSETVLIDQVFENGNGELIVAFGMVSPPLTNDVGWMRTNASGTPIEAKLWANPPHTSNLGMMALHPSGEWSYFIQSQDLEGAESTQFRFGSDGSLLYGMGGVEEPIFSSIHALRAHGDESYLMNPFGITKFSSTGTPLWHSGYIGQGVGFVGMESIHPMPEGVYFAFDDGRPGYGFMTHDGTVQWLKDIEGADALLQTDPSILHTDMVKQGDRYVIFADVSGEDATYLFTTDSLHAPIVGRKTDMQHEPRTIATTAGAGMAMSYAASDASTTVSLLVTGPDLDAGSCFEEVPFTVNDLPINVTPWFTDVYSPITSTWSNLAVTSTLVSATTAPVCSAVGMDEPSTLTPVVFPNPASDHMVVGGVGDGMRYRLHDATGRLVRHGTWNGDRASLNVADLVEGAYQLTVQDMHGRMMRSVTVMVMR